MKRKYLLIFSVFMAACTTPVGHTNRPMMNYDRDTEYNITDSEDGFSVTVFYSRYQFIPEGSTAATACKQQLTSIAYEHADGVGRKIEPINEQRIRISMGRNGLTGVTSCQAYGEAKWASSPSE